VVAPVDEVARQDLVLVEEDELRRAVGLVAEVRVVARLLAQAAVAAKQRPVLASGQGEAREDDGVPRVREGEARVGRRVDPTAEIPLGAHCVGDFRLGLLVSYRPLAHESVLPGGWVQ